MSELGVWIAVSAGRVDARRVGDMVPGRLELGSLAVHEVVVLDAVAVHQREAVDVGLLGDGAGLGRGHSRLRVRR